MMVRFSVWLCISKHIVSLLPFLVLFVSFFGNTKTVYNIKNNKLCFNDIKNLSLGLCSICINTDSICKASCVCVFSQAFVADFSYHENAMYYSLFIIQSSKILG